MALFKKRKNLQQTSGKVSREAISSILSESMHISGDICFKGKARIEGLVEGTVKGEYLVLSETGKIIGDITADSLICHGTIEGNISCKRVTAHPTSVIHGTLVAANLKVESGASLNGEIKALQKQAKAEKTSAPTPISNKKVQEAA